MKLTLLLVTIVLLYLFVRMIRSLIRHDRRAQTSRLPELQAAPVHDAAIRQRLKQLVHLTQGVQLKHGRRVYKVHSLVTLRAIYNGQPLMPSYRFRLDNGGKKLSWLDILTDSSGPYGLRLAAECDYTGRVPSTEPEKPVKFAGRSFLATKHGVRYVYPPDSPGSNPSLMRFVTCVPSSAAGQSLDPWQETDQLCFEQTTNGAWIVSFSVPISALDLKILASSK